MRACVRELGSVFGWDGLVLRMSLVSVPCSLDDYVRNFVCEYFLFRCECLARMVKKWRGFANNYKTVILFRA